METIKAATKSGAQGQLQSSRTCIPMVTRFNESQLFHLGLTVQ
jgi:hypothetical protein